MVKNKRQERVIKLRQGKKFPCEIISLFHCRSQKLNRMVAVDRNSSILFCKPLEHSVWCFPPHPKKGNRKELRERQQGLKDIEGFSRGSSWVGEDFLVLKAEDFRGDMISFYKIMSVMERVDMNQLFITLFKDKNYGSPNNDIRSYCQTNKKAMVLHRTCASTVDLPVKECCVQPKFTLV